MKIKLSDYIAQFLKDKGINHVWGISGGASIHMLHSCQKNGVEVICPHHEQAAGFAADGYARLNGMGCAVVTSGPGACNLITAIAGCYYDSIPCLFLCGQVVKNRIASGMVRQYGFQETPIVDMMKPITKYVSQVLDPKKIRYELERAVHIAQSERPGPVVLDIPDDVQRELIDPNGLSPYTYMLDPDYGLKIQVFDKRYEECIELLKNAERPVLICGWGVRLAKAEKELLELVDKLDIPVLPTWGLNDLFPYNHPNRVGTIGINGTRAGNFAVQNSDLVLAIGTRLSTRETGNPLESFARAAKMIVVDIDASELQKFPKFGKNIDLSIVSDAKEFIINLTKNIDENEFDDIDRYERWNKWWGSIAEWKAKYDPDLEVINGHEKINPYNFVDRLSRKCNEGDIIISDTGCGLAWLMQAFRFKRDQRFFHDFNNTAMGWSIPAAIGAHFASGKPIVCVVGDGSFMMNLQELSTISHHNLPIKIFVINNGGYSMVRQTEMEWLDGKNCGSGKESMSFPDYHILARSFDIWYERIEIQCEMEEKIRKCLAIQGPVLCNVVIPEDAKVWPKNKFGRPIEDCEPLLPRDEFRKNMIIEPHIGWDKNE